jgi:hypothetical protein
MSNKDCLAVDIFSVQSPKLWDPYSGIVLAIDEDLGTTFLKKLINIAEEVRHCK